MNTSRHIFYIFTIIFAGLFGLTSCDEMDQNGAFEGYWLLTEREGYEEPKNDGVRPTTLPEGGTSATDIQINTSEIITWGVRNDLIAVRNLRQDVQYYFTFTRSEKELQLHDAYQNDGSNDTKLNFEDLPANFCIPTDGRFDIISLDSKGMVLKGQVYTLHFKKN